jgi:hypothetical protein
MLINEILGDPVSKGDKRRYKENSDLELNYRGDYNKQE